MIEDSYDLSQFLSYIFPNLVLNGILKLLEFMYFCMISVLTNEYMNMTIIQTYNSYSLFPVLDVVDDLAQHGHLSGDLKQLHQSFWMSPGPPMVLE